MHKVYQNLSIESSTTLLLWCLDLCSASSWSSCNISGTHDSLFSPFSLLWVDLTVLNELLRQRWQQKEQCHKERSNATKRSSATREEHVGQRLQFIPFTEKLWKKCQIWCFKAQCELQRKGTASMQDAYYQCYLWCYNGLLYNLISVLKEEENIGKGREQKPWVCFKPKVSKLDIWSEYNDLKTKSTLFAFKSFLGLLFCGGFFLCF